MPNLGLTRTAHDIFSPTDAAGTPRGADMGEAQIWGIEIESILTAQGLSDLDVYSTQAELFSNLNHDANKGAAVRADPIVANRGIYKKIGASGSGSWVKVDDLPKPAIIVLTNTGGVNDLTATSVEGVNASGEARLLLIPITVSNTGAMTLNVDGIGQKPIVLNGGGSLPSGYMQVGSSHLARYDGTNFRLFSDGAAAAIQAAAEAARDLAEQYKNDASAVMNTVIDPQFTTRASAQAYSPASAPDYIRTTFYAVIDDFGGATYARVAAEPSHQGKLSITLSDDTTVVWYEIQSHPITLNQFGGGASKTGAQNSTALYYAIQCSVAQGGIPIRLGTGTIDITGRTVIPHGVELYGGGSDAEDVAPMLAATRLRATGNTTFMFTAKAGSHLHDFNIIGDGTNACGGIEFDGDRTRIEGVYCHKLVGTSSRAFALTNAAVNMNSFFLDNCGAIDCAGGTLDIAPIGSPDPQTAWATSTAYAISDVRRDTVDGLNYRCVTAHTSAASGTFSADRTANPSYWVREQFTYGESNANAGYVGKFDALRSNRGVLVENAFDVFFAGPIISQNNDEYGFSIGKNSAGCHGNLYLEQNGDGGTTKYDFEGRADAGSNEFRLSFAANVHARNLPKDHLGNKKINLIRHVTDGPSSLWASGSTYRYDEDELISEDRLGAGFSTAHRRVVDFSTGSAGRVRDYVKANGSVVDQYMQVDSDRTIHLGGRTVDDNSTAGTTISVGSGHRIVVGSSGAAANSFAVAGGATAGSIVVNSSSVNYLTTSDERLKNLPKKAEKSDGWLEKVVRGLPVYDYTFKIGGERGFSPIAQDVQKIHPTAVSAIQGEDGEEWLAVSWPDMVTPLILALADTHKQLADLRKEIGEIKK